MDRRQSVGLWVVMLAAVGAGWWWGGRAPDPPPPVDDSIPTIAVGVTITVHVGGWVALPGLVHLPSASRVADAISAAGGVLPGALVEAINLAEPLSDGMQVIVPGPADDSAEVGTGDGQASDGRVHLNRATAADLEGLPGIGPVIAERIVAHRDEHGPFTTVEDLLDVPGIGESKLQSLRDLVVVP